MKVYISSLLAFLVSSAGLSARSAENLASCTLMATQKGEREYYPFNVPIDQSSVGVPIKNGKIVNLYFLRWNDSNTYDVTVGSSDSTFAGGRVTYYREETERYYESFFWYGDHDSLGLMCNLSGLNETQ